MYKLIVILFIIGLYPRFNVSQFVFYPNNYFVALRILSYRESTVPAPISSLARYIYKILFLFFWFTIQILF